MIQKLCENANWNVSNIFKDIKYVLGQVFCFVILARILSEVRTSTLDRHHHSHLTGASDRLTGVVDPVTDDRSKGPPLPKPRKIIRKPQQQGGPAKEVIGIFFTYD